MVEPSGDFRCAANASHYRLYPLRNPECFNQRGFFVSFGAFWKAVQEINEVVFPAAYDAGLFGISNSHI